MNYNRKQTAIMLTEKNEPKIFKLMNKTNTSVFFRKSKKIKSFDLSLNENNNQDNNYYKNRRLINYSSIKKFNKNIIKTKIRNKEKVLEKINSFYYNYIKNKNKILSAKTLHFSTDLNAKNIYSFYSKNENENKAINNNIFFTFDKNDKNSKDYQLYDTHSQDFHKRFLSPNLLIDKYYNNTDTLNKRCEKSNIFPSNENLYINYLFTNSNNIKSQNLKKKLFFSNDISKIKIIANNDFHSRSNTNTQTKMQTQTKTPKQTDVNSYNDSNVNSLINKKLIRNTILKNENNLINTYSNIAENSYSLYSKLKFNKIIDDNFKNQIIINNNSNKENAYSFIQREKSKIRFKLITESQINKLNKIKEDNEIPLFQINRINIIVQNFKKYIYLYNEAFRKYILFLYGIIGKKSNELRYLEEIKFKLEKDISMLEKKINILTEDKKKLINIKILCLKVKYGLLSLDNLPEEVFIKYGLINSKTDINTSNSMIKNHKQKKILTNIQNKRYSIKKKISTIYTKKFTIKQLTKTNRAVSPKISKSKINKITSKIFKFHNIKENYISYKNRRSIELPKNYNKTSLYNTDKIFNDAQEFILKLDEKNNNIEQKYIMYNNNYEENLKLKIELSELQRLDAIKNEFLIQKGKLSKNNNKQVIIKPNVVNKNKINNNTLIEKININKINKKIKKMLLNYKIIDDILKFGKITELIKNAENMEHIRFNGEIYKKGIFYIKILELFYIKLIDWKNSCLKDPLIKQKYLILENKRKKYVDLYKMKERKNEEKIKLDKRNIKIMDRINKILIIPNKKEDPYSKKFEQDKEKKNRYKLFKKNDIKTQKEIYENFIEYQ